MLGVLILVLPFKNNVPYLDKRLWEKPFREGFGGSVGMRSVPGAVATGSFGVARYAINIDGYPVAIAPGTDLSAIRLLTSDL